MMYMLAPYSFGALPGTPVTAEQQAAFQERVASQTAAITSAKDKLPGESDFQYQVRMQALFPTRQATSPPVSTMPVYEPKASTEPFVKPAAWVQTESGPVPVVEPNSPSSIVPVQQEKKFGTVAKVAVVGVAIFLISKLLGR